MTMNRPRRSWRTIVRTAAVSVRCSCSRSPARRASARPPRRRATFGAARLRRRHRTTAPASPSGCVDLDRTLQPFATPSGLGPADIQSAYKLPTDAGAGRTVAIVDAYDLPTAESDLGVYRSQFGLPACTTANGCFRKINQNGGTTPPGRQRRLGRGDRARPRHGLGGLPALQDPARRGRAARATRTSAPPSTRRSRRAPSRSRTATAAPRAQRRELRHLVLQARRRRDHRVERRQRLRDELPRRLAVRHRPSAAPR